MSAVTFYHSSVRDERRALGWLSGRQWRKHRKATGLLTAKKVRRAQARKLTAEKPKPKPSAESGGLPIRPRRVSPGLAALVAVAMLAPGGKR